MKTAIIYCTKHGTTEKAARLIAEKLSGSDVSLINLDQEDEPDLSVFDRIIIGGSIHIGTIQKDIRNLCIKHLDELIQKERDDSWKYGGKTVFGNAKPPKNKPQNPNNQLELF